MRTSQHLAIAEVSPALPRPAPATTLPRRDPEYFTDWQQAAEAETSAW